MAVVVVGIEPESFNVSNLLDEISIFKDIGRSSITLLLVLHIHSSRRNSVTRGNFQPIKKWFAAWHPRTLGVSLHRPKESMEFQKKIK